MSFEFKLCKKDKGVNMYHLKPIFGKYVYDTDHIKKRDESLFLMISDTDNVSNWHKVRVEESTYINLNNSTQKNTPLVN